MAETSREVELARAVYALLHANADEWDAAEKLARGALNLPVAECAEGWIARYAGEPLQDAISAGIWDTRDEANNRHQYTVLKNVHIQRVRITAAPEGEEGTP